MAAPTLFSDLSTTAASNSPAGSDNVFPTLDEHLRALSSFVASIYANTATNGWTSPYLAKAGAFVWNDAGADVDARFEGDTDQNLLFLDASTDRIGIGTATPDYKVELEGASTTQANIKTTSNGERSIYRTEALTSGGASMTLAIGTYGDGATYSIVGSGDYPLTVELNGGEVTRIDGSGNLIQKVNGTAPTLGTNGTMSFELTSDTTLKIKVRGSDGATRSVSLTLA